MARSDNTADGRLEAEPEGTRSCRPHAASLRLHDPSASGSRSPSLLACSQHAQRRGLASLPNRLGSRKTNTTVAPASGGTTALKLLAYVIAAINAVLFFAAIFAKYLQACQSDL